jgi:hypothetical protein
MSSNHPAGPPMTLGNMRRLGAHRFIASCLNDACRHQGLIDVSKYPDDVECQSFHSRAVCAKCGARGRHIDVRSNWKEQPTHESLTGKVWRRFIFGGLTFVIAPRANSPVMFTVTVSHPDGRAAQPGFLAGQRRKPF